jgi:hypothetical protein
MRRFNRKAVLTAACIGLVGPSVFAIDVPEVEPNNTRATATPATLAPGDTISGTTTGTSTLTGGASVDFFDITTTAPGTAGVYRYRLALTTTGTAGHTGIIRGRTQTAGIVSATAEASFQTSTTATGTPARTVQWYSNGNASRILYRASGTATTTAPYAATLVRDPITPTVIAASQAAGTISISTVGQTGVTQTDTEIFLYDSNFNFIPNATNDEVPTPGTGAGSRLTRSLTPGTYIIAVSSFNTSNSSASPTDERDPNYSVLEFPNALANSSTTLNQNVGFSITDGLGAVTTQAATKVGGFDVLFFQMTVVATGNPVLTACAGSPSNTVNQGASVTLSTNVAWTNAPGTVTANLSAYGLSSTEALTDNGGGNYSIVLNVPGAQTPGATPVTITATDGSSLAGTCSIPLVVIVPPPANDLCDGAVVVEVGTAVATGNNSTATTAGDRTSTCISTKQSVWFDFTAPDDGTYVFDTETSAQADTVLTAFADCTPTAAQLGCDDEGGTDSLSRLSLAMTAGQNIKLMLSTWNSATAGGYVLNIGFTPPPCVVFTTQPATPATICAGSSLSFTAAANVLTGTPAFQWEIAPIAAGPYTALTDGAVAGVGTVSGATTSSLSITNADVLLNTQRIRVTVTGDCGNLASNNVGLAVLNCPVNDACSGALPAIVGTTAGNNSTANTFNDVVPACQSSSKQGLWYTFTAGPNGGTYLIDTQGSTQLDTVLQLVASCGGANIACDDDGGTTPPNSSRLVQVLTANQEIKIQVSTFNSATAGAFNLNIAECTLIGTQPVDATIAPGATAGFTVAATGPGTLTYVWQRQLLGAGPFTALVDGAVAGLGTVSGATTASLSIANAEAAASTDKFRVVVTSSCNAATSAEVTLTVANPYPARCNGADIAYDDSEFLPRAEIVDGTNGTPEIIGPFTGTNNGVTEADYNVFFANYFDANSVCDVANDDNSSRVPTPAPGTVTNNGVTEGDYNFFFSVFFDGCAF